MSGLYGTYRLNGRPADAADLGRMAALLAHRGPDGGSRHLEGGVGLGHRLLHTTPESRLERQPLRCRDRGLLLTADARIDNRDELIRTLRLQDRPVHMITDADLILAAYARWSTACPERLLGDFAFALWDGPRQRLFCARDAMGVRPFYYAHLPGRLFAFASEVKAVLAVDGVPPDLDELRIGSYLAGFGDEKERTFYHHIRRLPAGHALTMSPGGLTLRRHWKPDPERTLQLGSDAAYAEAFREVFDEAVRCRLRSAFPVGTALSGGLDSSSVTCTAARLAGVAGRAPLHTFTSVFPGLPEPERALIDERAYVAAVHASGAYVPHFVPADTLSPLHALPRVLWHQDEPFEMRNVYLGWSRFGAAQAAGVRVLLDGVEGDNTVSHGRGLLTELARRGDWDGLAREAHALAARTGIPAETVLSNYGFPVMAELGERRQWAPFTRAVSGVTRHFDVTARQLLWHYAAKPLLPARLWRLRAALARTGDPDAAAPRTVLAQAFVRRTDLTGYLREQGRDVERLLQVRYHTQREEQALSLGLGVHTLLLECGDRMAAAHGAELRHPFYDRRLIDLCLALPPTQKLQDGWSRAVLRRAMEGTVPDAVRLRPSKATLSPNFYRNLFQMEGARLARLPRSKHLTPYVDPQALEATLAAGDADALWPALMLDAWLEQQTTAPVQALPLPAALPSEAMPGQEAFLPS